MTSTSPSESRRSHLSPAKKRERYYDRFIPSRSATNLSEAFEELARSHVAASKNAIDEPLLPSTEPVLYDAVLNNEWDDRRSPRSPSRHSRAIPKRGPLFQFRSPAPSTTSTKSTTWSPHTLSPLSKETHQLLQSPRKAARKISLAPYKILDAPELQDDFYLNLLDWSAQNVLSVGLGASVYLWNANTSEVTQLCDLSAEDDDVASVAWCEKGTRLAVGTRQGFVQLWDVKRAKNVRTLPGHVSRVSSLAWNDDDSLASGSRDRRIIFRDCRSANASEHRLTAHTQEVCGLKWSCDQQYLASGGNDNRLYVWSRHVMNGTATGDPVQPVQCYTDHVAAVKAIAWSPHQHGLLASGGGTTDRSIRFWNTLTGHQQSLQCVDTNSQVCNLAWSKNANELVSTHGYSQNLVILWKYPSMQQLAKLTGHSMRVLYLGVSPDGQSIVTGAGDETLRFWDVFNKACHQKKRPTVLDPFGYIR